MRMIPTAVAALFLSTTALYAQEPTTVVLEGDPVPGVGLVSRIDHIAVNDRGEWRVEVDTDHADTDADGALLSAAGLELREGQALAAPPGSTLDSFDSISLDHTGAVGFNHFLDGTAGSFDDSGVYSDDLLVIQESDLVDSLAVSAGTPYIGFFDVKRGGSEQLAIVASIDDPVISSSVDRALVVVQLAGGVYVSTDVRWLEGELLAGQTEAVADFGTGPHQSAFNAAGQLLFFADLTGDSATDGVIYLDGALLAQEGSASPVAGRNWLSLSSPELALAAGGAHLYSGRLDGDTSSDALIVKDGAKFRQEGDTLPAIAPFVLSSFGSGPLGLTDGGDVLWYGDWSDPDTDVDTGLFLNDELLVQEGVTTIGGIVVDSLSGVQDGYAITPGGSHVIFEAVLANGREGAFLIELPLGERYCSPAVQNSTGQSGVIEAYGSPVAGGNPLRLEATQLPPNQFGFFLLSQTQGFLSGPGGSQGDLCLGGSIGRFMSQVQNSGSAGAFGIDVDTTSLPTSPPSAAQPGETWNFQGWHRDKNPMSTSNFTDAVGITFR